jgi:hypothetical protein
MLLLPIYEARYLRAKRRPLEPHYAVGDDPLYSDGPTIEHSLEVILTSAGTSPAAADDVQFVHPPSPSAGSRERSSFSIIKALWRSFCNIPPFCGEHRG